MKRDTSDDLKSLKELGKHDYELDYRELDMLISKITRIDPDSLTNDMRLEVINETLYHYGGTVAMSLVEAVYNDFKMEVVKGSRPEIELITNSDICDHFKRTIQKIVDSPDLKRQDCYSVRIHGYALYCIAKEIQFLEDWKYTITE